MVLVSRAIGFDVLLLPTFVIEFIPGPDMLPTWTGCTMAVILLRRKAEPAAPPTIEVTAEVTPAPDPGVVRPPKRKPPFLRESLFRPQSRANGVSRKKQKFLRFSEKA